METPCGFDPRCRHQRRSGLHIVRSDLFQRSELAHSVAPPFKMRLAALDSHFVFGGSMSFNRLHHRREGDTGRYLPRCLFSSKAMPHGSRYASCLHNTPSNRPSIPGFFRRGFPGVQDNLTRMLTSQSAQQNCEVLHKTEISRRSDDTASCHGDPNRIK